MTARRKLLTAAFFVIAIAIVVTITIAMHGRRDRKSLTDAAPVVQCARSFMADVVAGRYDAAATRTTPLWPARSIKGEFADIQPLGALASEEYMPIYRRRPMPNTVYWRVDAKLTFASGKVMYGQFAIVHTPANTYLIDMWVVEPWPKTAFTLGEATSDPYHDVEWAPGTRDLRRP
jgi:hypothetical protein